MSNITEQVIAYHLMEFENTDAEDITCLELNDWIDDVCEVQEINDFVRDYVDFVDMILNDETTHIYMRHSNDTIQDAYEWINSTDGDVWKGRIKEFISSAPRNSIYIVMS